jgi:hypothetical protein
LEVEERKRSIALLQKQKKEREELGQQLHTQKLAIEEATLEKPSKDQLTKRKAMRSRAKNGSDGAGRINPDSGSALPQ